MLRKHIHLLEDYGRSNDFAIYDTSDTEAMLRKILLEHFISPQDKLDKKKVDTNQARGRISAAKSAVVHSVGLNGISMLRALLETRPKLVYDPIVNKEFASLYDKYEAKLRNANAMAGRCRLTLSNPS